MSSTYSDIKDVNKEKYLSVTDFYNGKSIFITGGTGFLGKMYIQKILNSCPGIENIYMLVRADSKKTAQHRIMQMLENSSQLFKQLKEERPEALSKLVPIIGDLAKPKLGIQREDELLLREKVSIVIHCGATINIHDLLQDALNINVIGTQNVMALAKCMKKLQAFVHISTIFCAMNSNNEFVEEIVYPPPINVENIQNVRKQYGHMRQPPRIILGNKRNTYFFTKALTESIVQLNHGDLPITIIRPPLIGCADIEPYKGWIDVMNLQSYVVYGIAMGNIRILNIDKDTIWDFMPVDYVANLMILAATKCRRSKYVDVYNCSSRSLNPIKISTAFSIFISDFANNKRNNMPLPFVLLLKSKIIYQLLTPILQLTPAHISDLRCFFTGKKPNSVNSYKKFMELNKDITYYSRHWKMKSDRILSLLNTLSDDDKRTFPCDPREIEWIEYFKKYSEGVRNFTLRINKKKQSNRNPKISSTPQHFKRS